VPIAVACAATAAGGWAANRAGVPSSYLFAAILVGIAFALGLPGGLDLPGAFFPAGQAGAGVVVGTYLHTSTLTALRRPLGARNRPSARRSAITSSASRSRSSVTGPKTTGAVFWPVPS
jgi:hypothetical protein